MYAAKAWVAFAGAIITALTAALSDDILNATDTQQIILTAVPAIATLWGTYQTRNKDAK